MKEIHKHIRRLHKITIHHNRWLIWTIVLTVLSMSYLIFYISSSQTAIDHDMLDYTDVNQTVVYKNQAMGFSVRHPAYWGIESQTTNVIEFVDPQNNGNGVEVSVYQPSDEANVRSALVIVDEKIAMVDGIPGRELTVETAAGESNVYLVYYNHRLYVIKSELPRSNMILSTFNFLPVNIN